MERFHVPSREDVSTDNQAIFDNLQKAVGFVPNLYAYYAKNETALGDYLTLQNRKTTLKAKEKEVINLVVSQFNGCNYCLSAHTQIAQMNGLTEDRILEIRTGAASFDDKLHALAKFVLSTVENKGRADEKAKEEFFAAGYTEANMIDVVIVIGDKTISNFIHNLADFKIDFPLAEELRTSAV